MFWSISLLYFDKFSYNITRHQHWRWCSTVRHRWWSSVLRPKQKHKHNHLPTIRHLIPYNEISLTIVPPEIKRSTFHIKQAKVCISFHQHMVSLSSQLHMGQTICNWLQVPRVYLIVISYSCSAKAHLVSAHVLQVLWTDICCFLVWLMLIFGTLAGDRFTESFPLSESQAQYVCSMCAFFSYLSSLQCL